MSEEFIHWSQQLSDLELPDGEMLRAYRKRHDLSTAQASTLISVSVRTWERYENNSVAINKSSWLFLLLIANEVSEAKVLII